MRGLEQTIGMVLGTEDATPLQFWFAVTDGVKVQLDDVIAVEVADPERAGERGALLRRGGRGAPPV